jgi:hypothetical protein
MLCKVFCLDVLRVVQHTMSLSLRAKLILEDGCLLGCCAV